MSLFDGMSDVFLDVLGNGTATWTPQGAGAQPRSIPVIWEPRTVVWSLDEATGQELQGTGITAHARTADCPGIRKGDTLTYSGVSYRVARAEPDQYGMTVIMLRGPRDA